MIGRDALNTLSFERGLSPQIQTNADTAFVSEIIDMSTKLGLTFAILLGALTDAGITSVVLMEEGDDSALSDAAAVADADMLSMTDGTAPELAAAFTQASDNLIKTIGYIGIKRYVRLTVTPTGNAAGDINIGILAVGLPRLRGNVTGS
jgi:hypothetical protein